MFHGFKSWAEVVDFSESDIGAELKSLVILVEQWKSERLKRALESVQKIEEKHADMVISTAHGVKGKEYSTVKLADDFVFPSSSRAKCHAAFSDEEARLLYVAETRAKHAIDISECTAAQLALDDKFGNELRAKRQKQELDTMLKR